MARKTHTSTEVKQRYNDRVYTRIPLSIPKELAAEFKAKCEKNGVSMRSVLIESIEYFLKTN